MIRIRRSRPRPLRRPPKPRARLEVELLEHRNLPSTGTFGLTALVQVSDPNPLPAPSPSSPTVFPDSEVEPQIAVNPANTSEAVAIWQQDRFRSVGGARALVVSATANGNDPTATWSAPAPIPWFNSTDPLNSIDPVTGQGYARYTDPWVSIAPNGVVWATALAMTPTGPVPGHTAVMVLKGSIAVSASGVATVTWDSAGPTTLIRDDAATGTNPADLANDKEMVIADPTNSNNVFVVWDRLNQPDAVEDFNAAHGRSFREDMMFARTTNGGMTWDGGNYPAAVAGYPASDITNFQANLSAFGNEIVVQPDGTLVDVFTRGSGSGNQKPQADHNVIGVMRSIDHGSTWSGITTGPGIEALDVTDPDTGALVRSGDPLISVAVDPNLRSTAHPNGGNIYAVWADGRFSNFTHDDIAFSMSTDGGLTWSAPVKVNQTPTTIPAGDQQAFTPTVAVNSDGTVAVTYYDFRNNDASKGLLTDYWIVGGSPTNPAGWTEVPLTTSSFNMENAAPTSRGYFLGDYQGLAAAGTSFYALFAQAGSSTSDPSNIFFRDPPPAPGVSVVLHLAGDPGSLLAPETTAYLFASGGLTEDLSFLAGGYVPAGNGPHSDDVYASSDFEKPSDDGRLSLAADRLFANSGDTIFSNGLGSDVAFVSLD